MMKKKCPPLCVLCAILCALWGNDASAAPPPDGEALLAQRPDMGAWEDLSKKWEAANALTEAPVEDLALPLEHYDNGRVRTVLRGERAYLLGGDQEGLVFARKVKVERLATNGKPEGVLLAEDCLIDRNTRRGYCRGAVEVRLGGDTMKGRGLYFSTDDQFYKLLAECEIRTFRIPVKFGRLQ